MSAKEEGILEVKAEIKALKKEMKASRDPKVAKLVCVWVCGCVGVGGWVGAHLTVSAILLQEAGV